MRLFPETPVSDDLASMTPVARDMIFLCYAQINRPAAALAAVSRCHAHLWSGLLIGLEDPHPVQRELSRLADRANIGDSALDWVNRQVMAELLETIARRFTRSPGVASRLSFEVARAACGLTRAQASQTQPVTSSSAVHGLQTPMAGAVAAA
jgi:hypothetical protein